MVTSDGDSATVRLSLKDSGEPPLKVRFVRVEDKWVPEGIAKTWEANIAAFHKQLDEDLPKWLAAKKVGTMLTFDIIERSLTELEATRDPAEFQKRFSESPVIHIVLWALRSGTEPGTPVTKTPNGKNGKQPPKTVTKKTITVIVVAELDDKTADSVADLLFDLGKNVDVGDFVREKGKTRFRVSTATDFEAFRKLIRFATIVSADAEKREIVIRLK